MVAKVTVCHLVIKLQDYIILHYITLETIYSGLSKVISRTTMATQLYDNVWVGLPK